MTDLRLYEALMLIALKRDKGTMSGTYLDQAIAAGVLGELIADGHLVVGEGKRAKLTLVDEAPTGEPVMDATIEKMSGRRDAALETWIQRISGMRGLKRRVAERLVERGVLEEKAHKRLGVVSEKRYPETDPQPGDDLRDRLRAAVLGDGEVDEQTCLLIAIADAASMLSQVFSRQELSANKKRIKALAEDERLGPATRRAIEAIQAAIVVVVAASASAGST